LVALAFATTIIALAGYLGALLIAFIAVANLRRHVRAAAEIEALKTSLAELLAAEQRRFMTEIKSAEPGRAPARSSE
jgi:hypothetical protein